jgi:hypothetical protein
MRIIDVEQGSPEWRALRLGIPTATDFDSMITAVKGDLSAGADGCINKLIDELVRPELQEESFTGNRHTEHGKEWEPKARAWYAFTTGNEVRQVGFVLRDDGKAGCSPDSLVGESGGLEIKCPDGPTHVSYLRKRTLPDKYKQQVHGSMVITGRRWWDFLSYCPGYRPFLIRVHWDEYTDKVAAAIESFIAKLETAKAEIITNEGEV